MNKELTIQEDERSLQKKELFERLIKKSLLSGMDINIQRCADRQQGRLSQAQESIYYGSKLRPGIASLLHMSYAVNVSGNLNEAAFADAVSAIVERHEVLRTIYDDKAGAACAKVLKAGDGYKLPVKKIDYSDEDAGAQLCLLHVFAEKFFSKSFRLQKDIPFRAASVCFEKGKKYVLFFCFHHICTDAWSMEIFCKELSVLYNCFLNKTAHPFAPLSIQCIDYASWQQDWIGGVEGKKKLQWWTDQLPKHKQLFADLPYDEPRYPVPYLRTARIVLPLDPAVVDELKELAKREGGSLYMILLGCFTIAMEEWTKRPYMPVGTLTPDRRSEASKIMGALYNTVIVFTDLSGSMNTVEKIRAVIRNCVASFQHEQVPFTLINNIATTYFNIDNLLPVMFLTDKYPMYFLELEDTRTEGMHIEIKEMTGLHVDAGKDVLKGAKRSEIFLTMDTSDITFFIREGKEWSYTLSVFYKPDLFYETTILDITASFIRIMTNVNNQFK